MKKFAFLCLCILLLVGCNHLQRTRETSSDEWEEKINQSPWLITADYFRQEQKKQEKRTLSPSKKQYLKRKILVCCFLSPKSCAEWQALGIELEATKKVLIVGHKRIDPLLKKFHLHKDGLLEADTRRKIGNLLGLQAFLFLRLASDEKTKIEIYDGITGNFLTSLVTTPKEQNKIAVQIADYIFTNTTWEGRIAYIEGDKVYLNVGRLSGLKKGDILSVYAQGKEVINPVTGISLGYLGEKKGKIKIISFFGENASVAKILSGKNFKINDIVRLEEER